MDHVAEKCRGIFHVHTEYSVKNASMIMNELFSRAKELGAPAIVISDYNLCGYMEAANNMKKYGIKAVAGVEVDVSWQNNHAVAQGRMLLIPCTQRGFEAIRHAIAESKQPNDGSPAKMDRELLFKWFGIGSAGYGQVIVTTAGVSGIAGSFLLRHFRQNSQIEEIDQRLDKYQKLALKMDTAREEKTRFKKLMENSQSREEHSDLYTKFQKSTAEAIKAENEIKKLETMKKQRKQLSDTMLQSEDLYQCTSELCQDIGLLFGKENVFFRTPISREA